MTIIGYIIDFVAVVISLIALKKSVDATKRNEEIAEEQIRISQGSIELEISSQIKAARDNIMLISLQMEEKPDSEVLKKAFFSAEEQLRNAYENACSLYIDNKIDRERFRKSYQREIRQLVEDKNQNKFYSQINKAYPCTCKVYEQWNNEV